MKSLSSPEFLDAVLRGDVRKVSYHINAGADPNATDQDERTPLMHAAIDDNLELLRYLLEIGADPNKQDKGGWTALHFAAQERGPEIAAALIQRGALVDATDAFGNTPLWRAVFSSKGDGRVIELLLSGAADPDLKNRSGVSPRKLATQIANYDIARFFR